MKKDGYESNRLFGLGRILGKVRALYPADRTAGDFCAGIACRLGVKIVRHIMNYHRSAHDIFYTKTPCFHCQIGISMAEYQRRQIPGVEGVWCFGGVIVAKCVGKVYPCTSIAGVDMETKEAGIGVRQTPDGCLYQNAMLPLVESYFPAQFGVGCRAADLRYGAGSV